MRGSKLFTSFFKNEQSSAVVLIACTLLSLILANSNWSAEYVQFWNTRIFGHSFTHWINDALMSFFFLLIGLELKREIRNGELASPRNALFPVLAALGGVLVPACLYTLFNYNTPTQSGAGIPMATDIAFAVGVLALLGKGVPLSLKIFLTALAVIDDLCAIVVIAVFYSTDISLLYLGYSLGIALVLWVCSRMRVHHFLLYLIGGIGMWYCMYLSGIHATLSAVLLAFIIPYGHGKPNSLSYKLQTWLHTPVAFLIVPLFALANTALPFAADWHNGLMEPIGAGIIIGLVIGKPLGIFAICGLAVRMKLCKLPHGLNWKHILGAGMLAGIGFTMSIFISLLAFEESHFVDAAKISILIGSLISAICGLVFLKSTLKKNETDPIPR